MTMTRTAGMFKTVIASPGFLEKPDVVYEITARDIDRLPDIIKENISVIAGVREILKAGECKCQSSLLTLPERADKESP
jgi:stalled ribosome rescue protein Dom34